VLLFCVFCFFPPACLPAMVHGWCSAHACKRVWIHGSGGRANRMHDATSNRYCMLHGMYRGEEIEPAVPTPVLQHSQYSTWYVVGELSSRQWDGRKACNTRIFCVTKRRNNSP
jgi:hypothetical protein